MEPVVALAIDESVHAADATRYAAKLSLVIPQLQWVLLHVQPALSQYLKDEARLKPSARIALQNAARKNEARARETLEAAAQRMLDQGVEETRIRQRTFPRVTGVADDILAMGQAESYDAILVGRRGASYLREWVMGSVAANLIEHSRLIPIWVVDGRKASDKILLAADGSRSSLRALDHLAFIHSSRKNSEIHVLHIQPRFQNYCEISLEVDAQQSAETAFASEDKNCMQDFHRQALTVLEKNGIHPDRLRIETLSGSLSIPRAILQYARDNSFGTLVMGKRGTSKSRFAGSVSHSLLHKASQCALWVVP